MTQHMYQKGYFVGWLECHSALVLGKYELNKGTMGWMARFSVETVNGGPSIGTGIPRTSALRSALGLFTKLIPGEHRFLITSSPQALLLKAWACQLGPVLGRPC